MYRVVVVGTDGSSTADKAVEAAAHLSRLWGSTLHVVTAYKSGTYGMANAAGAPLVDFGAESAVREEAARQIGQRAMETWCGDLDARHHAVAGDAADAILDTSKSLEADVIIVGSKGMRGARRLLGSVPNSVCHRAECSVLVVKTD
jgi:nucleotide-binding universal stress UspA family protein